MDEKLILLVEDNEDDVELTRLALEKNRICNRIIVARDGAEALDHLFGGGELPQLILLDLNMPRMQFTEAVRQLGLYWLVLNVSPPASP